ncbi:MAG: cache domain-containing protein [Clostridiales bacterium]|nr:cache domain-containing protein [Clostridiales bacterium]
MSNKQQQALNSIWDEANFSHIHVDMHCHSTFSDGNMSPEEIAKNLHDADIKYASLVDHNTLSGLPSFRLALAKYSIGFVSGVEITTEHKNHFIHLLAYGFDIDNPELNSLFTKKKNNNDVTRYTTLHSFLTAGEIIELVHNAGGIVSLAHPLQTEPDRRKLKVLIKELHKLELDAIEALYERNTTEENNEVLQLAEKYALIATAGSDYHAQKETPGTTITAKQWNSFRNALLKTSSNLDQETALQTNLYLKKPKNKWFSFILNIFLPAFLSLALFIIALFAFLLPYFENTLMDRKRENIRQLTQVAWGVLNESAQEVKSGDFTLDQAQTMAKNRIAAMRYGTENKDYFWIQDTSPRILMHPYRTDLNNQDVSDFEDAQGTKIFVEFSNLVLEKGEGYFSYVWQWKDDTDRLEPKESYIRLFEPWEWIIGTGIYINDVQAEIANLRSYIVKISLAVISIVLLLLIYLIRQGMLLEQSREEAEKLLLESVDRYQALSEAATEGALFIFDGRCRYANTVMYELLGCTPDKIELLNLQDIFPQLKANKQWLKSLAASNENDSSGGINGVIRRCDGTLLSCHLSVKSGLNNAQSGFMILVRRSVDLTEHTGAHVALNRLLHIPNSLATDLADSIKNAYNVDEVVTLSNKKSDLVVSLLENGTSSIAIAYMISVISDLTTQKIIKLSIDEIGKPPAPFAFMALGSHGRQSQTLFSDQDNAIVYTLTGDEDKEVVQAYFLRLATIVCDALELAGFEKCTGKKIASNPEWCKPLSIWKSYFTEWIRNSEPQQVIEFSILFDFRTVSGDAEIASELREFIYSEINETPFFLTQIAQNALIFKTPFRLFGNIMTSGGKDHPGRIDVKTPAMAIVTFARLYALKNTIQESNTLLQLDAIKGLGIILDSKHRDIVLAYETLMRLRLWNQALAIKKNQQIDNWIDPDQLSELEEVVLRECFKEIDDFQNMIQQDFLG